MQEADADHALADADLLGRAGAGLRVLRDVLVQLHEVLHGLVVALELHHGVDDQLRGAGGVRVGHPDQALVFRLEQIVPALGGLKAQALQLLGVDHEAQDALVNAVPVAVRIAVHVRGQIGGVGRLIAHQQAGLGALVVRVGRAAEPDVAGRVARFLSDLRLHLAGGQTLIVGLDAIKLLKVLGCGSQIRLLAGTIDDQLALLLRGSDQGRVDLGAGNARKGQHEHSSHQERKQFLHSQVSFSVYLHKPAHGLCRLFAYFFLYYMISFIRCQQLCEGKRIRSAQLQKSKPAPQTCFPVFTFSVRPAQRAGSRHPPPRSR